MCIRDSTGKHGLGQVFGTPFNRSPPRASRLDRNDRLARRRVGFAKRFVVGAMLRHEGRLAFVAKKVGCYGHRTACIQHMHHWLAVMGRNLDSRVRPARGCPPDEQRQLEALTLHFAGNVHHLVERRRD